MQEYIVLTKRQISEMLISAAEKGASNVLIKIGQISPLISRSEIIRQIGRTKYDQAVDRGELTPIKNGGKNSKIYVQRSEYENYLTKLSSE